MPRLAGIKPSRNVCMCEQRVLIEAGAARWAGIMLEILDRDLANRVAREHHRAVHAGGPPFEPIV